jgi:predicted CXXCH cytochrome family protein
MYASLKLTVAVFVACILFAAFSTPLPAKIQGSSHDFSDDDLGTSDLCKFCHISHDPLSQTDAPLWNHADSTQTFTFYDGTTGAASGTTLMCLSCHDGVTNIDAFGDEIGTVDLGTKFPGTTAVIGTDLHDDHPVIVPYVVVPGKFKDVSGSTAVKLFDGKVECASCHNPHLVEDNQHFLRSTNENSALCLTCHNK